MNRKNLSILILIMLTFLTACSHETADKGKEIQVSYVDGKLKIYNHHYSPFEITFNGGEKRQIFDGDTYNIPLVDFSAELKAEKSKVIYAGNCAIKMSPIQRGIMSGEKILIGTIECNDGTVVFLRTILTFYYTHRK